MEWYKYLERCIPYTTFTHYKGGLYEFVTLANLEGEEEPIVVYKSVSFGTHKAQKISRFFGETENGERRFIVAEL